MTKIIIKPRPLSPGELHELKRIQTYALAKEKNKRPGTYTNNHAIPFRPPKSDYSALNLAPDNEGI